LVKGEHFRVFKLILLAVFKDFAIFGHEGPLHSFKLLVKNDILKCSHHGVKVDILWGRGVVFLKTAVPSAIISNSYSSSY